MVNFIVEYDGVTKLAEDELLLLNYSGTEGKLNDPLSALIY